MKGILSHDVPLFRAWVYCTHHHLENGQWADAYVMGDVQIFYDRKRGVRVRDGSITGWHDYLIGDKCHVMMFTGLFDRNNIPLYEGDIFEVRNLHSMLDWNTQDDTELRVCPRNFVNSFALNIPDGYDFKIIGDVFTCPELVNKYSLQFDK